MNTYQRELQRFFQFHVPQHSRVLMLGCREGDLLASLAPRHGLGLDASEPAIAEAKTKYGEKTELLFRCENIEKADLSGAGVFDYILLPDIIPLLKDVQATFAQTHAVLTPKTRLIVNFHSNLWRPLLSLATRLGIRRKVHDFNWLSANDVKNLLYLAGFETVTCEGRVLLPFYVPLLSPLFNRLVAKLPFIGRLCLTWFAVARPRPDAQPPQEAPSVSILVPTRNEKGNIENIFKTTLPMGSWSELVFVDGHSDDGTLEEIERCTKAYSEKWPKVKLLHQTGKGKGQAVRQGFAECEGDILMILDSDLTMPAEELPKYYEAIVSGKGEFINGCRLVYPQEEQAMRFLNMIANHTFAHLFTWLLGQSIKDTLCGTKVLWRSDYQKIAENRAYFGDFDPFGDFDLLFGAAKLNLKIVDLPIRYRERTYGEIKINRWRDGVLLLRMSWIAFRRLKLS